MRRSRCATPARSRQAISCRPIWCTSNRVGETYGVTYNPAHRWFYVPEMQPDEALLLKCFDSATDGRARFAPHTAFEDPTAPADVLPRESIEIRTLVFHEA